MRRQEQDRFRGLIKEKLREKDYTRKLLAHVIGKSPGAITRKMNGTTAFNDDEVQKISQFLRIPEFINYPLLQLDAPPPYETYDPGAKVFHDALSLLSLHDRKDMYYVIAVYVEAKLPSTKLGTILRELATQP
jgi:transcriptional regulator with XRE-family HTH domain